MNGKQAKRIRRAVYGDNAHLSDTVRRQVKDRGTIANVGLRRGYQAAKKTFKALPGPRRSMFLRQMESMRSLMVPGGIA